jgi:hypothetical protein
MMYMASWPFPGIRSLNSGARYCTLELELYVLVDFLEALVGQQFRLGGAE